MLDFYRKVTDLLARRRRFAVATVLSTSGSAPRGPGAKMIVTDTGEIFFSVGGGAFEAMVVQEAGEALRDGAPREREYRFRERGENAVGMTCGGRARVLIEVLRGPDRLLVFGAGHVGRALAEKAGGLDLELVVVDDREEFLAADRFPEGTRRICAGPGFAGGFPVPDRDTYACVLTRCHRTDVEVLRRLAPHPAAYVGLIGSRRKAIRIVSQLRSEGVARPFLESIRSPIGIDVGGSRPAEIAVAILAEVLQVRNRLRPQAGRSRPQPDPIDAAVGRRRPGATLKPG